MIRYITRRASIPDMDESVTADHIYIDDDRPQPTGVYDAAGLPIYRVRDRQPVGFHNREP